MRSTIDAAGRVVVPKRMRDRLGLTGGAEIDIEEHDGVVEIRAPSRRVRLETHADGRPVLVAEGDGPTVDEGDVRAVVEELRRWPRS